MIYLGQVYIRVQNQRNSNNLVIVLVMDMLSSLSHVAMFLLPIGVGFVNYR